MLPLVAIAASLLHSRGLPSLPPVGVARPTSVRTAVAAACGNGQPSFFDRLLYGTNGKPAPTAPPSTPSGPPTLEKFFRQLDRDGNDGLDRDELKRALLLVGVTKVDFDAVFDLLDANGDGLVTFAEFDAELPSSTRQAIERRLNSDGVLDSLYVPPEQWSEDRSKAELQWEQKVQMQARREGSGLRQNDILKDELGKQ